MCAVKISSERQSLCACMLAHNLLNRISVIMGNCDLVNENTPAGSENAKLLSLIRENARWMATELSRYQSELFVLTSTERIDKNHRTSQNHKAQAGA